jgi:hypothetical protein
VAPFRYKPSGSMLTASQTYSFLYDAKLKSTQILIGDGIIQYASEMG